MYWNYSQIRIIYLHDLLVWMILWLIINSRLIIKFMWSLFCLGVWSEIFFCVARPACNAEGNEDSIFSSSIDSARDLTEDAYTQVIALLELVRTSSRRSAEASALFLQELADVLRRGVIHSRVEVCIRIRKTLWIINLIQKLIKKCLCSWISFVLWVIDYANLEEVR